VIGEFERRFDLAVKRLSGRSLSVLIVWLIADAVFIAIMKLT